MAEVLASDMTDEQIEALLEEYHVREADRVRFRDEAKLSRALRAECFAMAERVRNGDVVPQDAFMQRLTEVAESMGHHMGIPMPDVENGHQFVTARNTPLGFSLQYNTGRTEHAGELERLGAHVRNSWETVGDRSVAIIECPNGEIEWMPDYHAGRRLRKIIGGNMTRAMLPHLTAETELKAMDCLKEKINESQWNSYVLSGMFAERSTRSDLHYIFRKGFPTLVLSYHREKTGGAIIAALCLHPFGYYAGTHVGAMTPTDEVIAHLLMMRGDEHKFWGKSGQWSAIDPRSGI